MKGGGRVINDTLGDFEVVLIGEAGTRTVRAYRGGGHIFRASATGPGSVVAAGQSWRIEEDALVSVGGERLARLPGHIAFWFAWSGFRTDAPLFEDSGG